MNTFKAGDNVFFQHPEHSWLCGVIKAITKGGIVCVTKDPLRKEVIQGELITVKTPEEVVPLHEEYLLDAPDDLLDLTILHESSLLRCFYLRYMNDVIYTNIGGIVVALNPFTFAVPWYKDTQIRNYLDAGRNLSGASIPSNLMPHSWAQAHVAYYEMVDSNENQCIIVSGESGAGKTEAIKLVLKYLGIVSSLSETKEEQEAALHVGKKLIACSPILECFGNAKTVINDNSSRFGKFMKVKFSAKHRLVGAETTKYLLEKSRIISAAQGERVYHSFYLLARAKASTARVLGLEYEKEYASLYSGGIMNNTKYDTENDFDHVSKAMRLVGMTDGEIASVWRVTAAVTSLINIRFLPEEHGCSIDLKTMKYLRKAIQLLDINEDGLVHEFLTSTRVCPGNVWTSKANDVAAAVDIRDAMCKHLYDGVFGWIVDRCNDLCDIENDGNWIGLLDIFGFENLKINSFEQLCINLMNEHLQYHYNLLMFQRDMDECRMEGVDVTKVKFADNIGCLKMLTAQGGIFPLLDECCWRGRGTDLGFLEKVMHTHKSNIFFNRKLASGETFCVRHYAAQVTYNVIGWIDKNRDNLKDSIKSLVRGSGDSVIARCLPAPVPPSERRGGKEFTVSGFFRNQLMALMDLIGSTNPHWIRCIKPHPDRKPSMFCGREVMKQLESSGVLGTVKMRKNGYPVRIPRDLFCREYRMCTSVGATDEKAFIQSVLQLARVYMPAQAQIGKSKIFLKTEGFNLLEKLRNQHLFRAALIVQRIARGYLTRTKAYTLFAVLNNAELFWQTLGGTVADLHGKEVHSRHLCELEEDQAWSTLKKLEYERRLYQETIEAAERERGVEEEARRLREVRHRAAICIQRHVRGCLVRIQWYRKLLEERRAALESERELACMAERAEMQALDTQRITDEKSWLQWLNTVDSLRRQKQEDEQRLLEKTSQKTRIRIRELVRKEDEMRLKIELHESDARFALFSHHQYLTAYYMKSEAERRRRVEKLQVKGTGTFCPRLKGIQTRGERSAASDARMQKTLAEYALSRVRSDSERQECQNAGLAPDCLSPSTSKESLIFCQVQKKWLRQQEWMNLKEVGQQPARNPSAFSMLSSADDGEFSGPYRTIEASLHSLSPLKHGSSYSARLSTSGLDSRGKKESSQISYEAEWRRNKKDNSIDWDSVFGA
ncbi:putative myosin heavy chain [Trypanosoma rangeli]|uniref:Putative myosin heavy chain n=1 Tax=Trypanosoma rangeli TaxID=5698 RepID=A0A3R7LHC0_TRYRA|nr:putative myosin heavy chain [Trypanosoma rangeli]RNE97295.1 putative myosin heavy chain [Trypanosoma rangeli]|eukprot:RNE97295.1 putative myosin heavy chain [Trypanosoma rangeli]